MSDDVRVRPEAFWEDVRYGDDGLVPVVVQARDGLVLMLAYADREALRRTATERRAWFWSRARRALWRKGETSGHVLQVEEVRWDCDADAVLYTVLPHGPACHTGQNSCFYRGERPAAEAPVGEASPGAQPAAEAARPDLSLGAALDAVASVVAQRARTRPQGSYVASLLAAGPPRALQKVGEEAVEAVIAGLRADGEPDAVVREFADLFFHALVALAALGLPPGRIAAELARRAALRPSRSSPA